MPERIHIGSCPVDCVSFSRTLEILLDAVGKKEGLLVAPINAATVVMASQDPSFRAALEQMDVLLSDGYWLTLAARVLGSSPPEHVATVPLTYELLRRLAKDGRAVFLLGAEAPVVEKAGVELGHRFAGIRVVGKRDGYFSEAQEDAICQEIIAAKPDMLLIGISSPKKELFMARRRRSLQVPITIGVGGLIDILGGKTKAGPEWLRNHGLMWLYRLVREPRRLWKRYSVTNSRFVWLVIRQAVEVRSKGVRKR